MFLNCFTIIEFPGSIIDKDNDISVRISLISPKGGNFEESRLDGQNLTEANG